MRRSLVTSLTASTIGMVLAATAAPAAADPVRQPFNEGNCHGFVLSHFATADPGGVGNTVGGPQVQSLHDIVRVLCDVPQP